MTKLMLGALTLASMLFISGAIALDVPLDYATDPVVTIEPKQTDVCELGFAITCADTELLNVALVDLTGGEDEDEAAFTCSSLFAAPAATDLIGNLIRRYDPGWCLT